MNETQEGLRQKYEVTRTDGKEKEAAYFVLDYKNDPIARRVLGYYAELCFDEYPTLSSDLWIALRDEWIQLDK